MSPKPDPNNPAKPDPAKTPPSFPVAVRVPVQLHAFVLNAAACDAGPSYVAPIVQPDYRALRLGQSLKHDILPHIDLQGCETSKTNPRIKNLSSPPPPGVGREGIYLHWTLPPLFRTGTARTKAAGQPDDLQVREPRFDVQERFDSSPIGTSSSTSMGFTPANFYTTCTLGSTTQSSCTFYSCYRNVHDRKQQDKKNSRQGSR
jgi:hypothetical protein